MGGATPGTKRVKVERACEICRKKRAKCDGVRPTCGPCFTGDLECVYDESEPELHSRNIHMKLDTLESLMNQRLDNIEIFLQRVTAEAEQTQWNSKREDPQPVESFASSFHPNIRKTNKRGHTHSSSTSSELEADSIKLIHESTSDHNLISNTLPNTPPHEDDLQSSPLYSLSHGTDKKSYFSAKRKVSGYSGGTYGLFYNLVSGMSFNQVNKSLGDDSITRVIVSAVRKRVDIYTLAMERIVRKPLQSKSFDLEFISFVHEEIKKYPKRPWISIIRDSKIDKIIETELDNRKITSNPNSQPLTKYNGREDLFLLSAYTIFITPFLISEMRANPISMKNCKFSAQYAWNELKNYIPIACFEVNSILIGEISFVHAQGLLLLAIFFTRFTYVPIGNFLLQICAEIMKKSGYLTSRSVYGLTAEQAEVRKETAWLLYVTDKVYSLTTGASQSVHNSDISIPLPKNLNGAPTEISSLIINLQCLCASVIDVVYSKKSALQKSHPDEIIDNIYNLIGDLEKLVSHSVPPELNPKNGVVGVKALQRKQEYEQREVDNFIIPMMLLYFSIVSFLTRIPAYYPQWIDIARSVDEEKTMAGLSDVSSTRHKYETLAQSNVIFIDACREVLSLACLLQREPQGPIGSAHLYVVMAQSALLCNIVKETDRYTKSKDAQLMRRVADNLGRIGANQFYGANLDEPQLKKNCVWNVFADEAERCVRSKNGRSTPSYNNTPIPTKCDVTSSDSAEQSDTVEQAKRTTRPEGNSSNRSLDVPPSTSQPVSHESPVELPNVIDFDWHGQFETVSGAVDIDGFPHDDLMQLPYPYEDFFDSS